MKSSTGKITIAETCSASTETIWWHISGTVGDTVIYGNIASLGCAEWHYFALINSKLIPI